MLEEPPLLTIRRQFARPAADLLTRLANAQTGHVTDAMDGLGAVDAAIKPVDRERAAFVGVALPCKTGPGDNLAIAAAIGLAKPGDAIVVAADGFMGLAVCGDNLALMARNAGVAGIVIDGAVRDVAGIVAAGVPMFARGVTPNSCARSGPGRIGLPVVCGGVAVTAGDVVVADADGVVVIPQSLLGAVLSRLETIVAAEQAVQQRIAGGLTRLDGIDALLRSERVRYLD
jgi:4-hydroxy-4-methyl-2-oxoglutarate aldolase